MKILSLRSIVAMISGVTLVSLASSCNYFKSTKHALRLEPDLSSHRDPGAGDRDYHVSGFALEPCGANRTCSAVDEGTADRAPRCPTECTRSESAAFRE